MLSLPVPVPVVVDIVTYFLFGSFLGSTFDFSFGVLFAAVVVGFFGFLAVDIADRLEAALIKFFTSTQSHTQRHSHPRINKYVCSESNSSRRRNYFGSAKS